MKQAKVDSSPVVQVLDFEGDLFVGDDVADGFYHAMSKLKTNDHSDNPEFIEAENIHRQIIELAKIGTPIPPIPLEESSKILMKMKANVSDIYSISPRHFIESGEVGLGFFNFLLNLLIENVNLTSLPALNSAWSIVLYKGHNKPKSSYPSYRCISLCPCPRVLIHGFPN